jgi:paraquat-inducible protein A
MTRVPSPAKVMSVRVLWALSCLFFGAALALPLISITPGVGELTHWLRLLKPDAMATVTQTMFSSISHLWEGGDRLLATLLVVFCLVLPVGKFFVLGCEAFSVAFASSAFGRLVTATAPYAMVEVFLLALLVLVIKGLPGGSKIELQSGAWLFAASVLLSLLVAALLKGRGLAETAYRA